MIVFDKKVVAEAEFFLCFGWEYGLFGVKPNGCGFEQIEIGL
jgi:hypothetical protein